MPPLNIVKYIVFLVFDENIGQTDRPTDAYRDARTNLRNERIDKTEEQESEQSPAIFAGARSTEYTRLDT